MSEPAWFEDHSNIIALVSWMATENMDSIEAVVDAVEKPWKYETEFRAAEHSAAKGHPTGTDFDEDGMDEACCLEGDCGWTWSSAKVGAA